MRKRKYCFRVNFKVMNKPFEDDYHNVKDFDEDYLFHSYASAEKEFSRVKSIIENGELLRNMDPDYVENVKFHLEVKLLNLRDESELFLYSLKSKNVANESWTEILVNQDSQSARNEAKRGFLRHAYSISETYFFSLRVTEIFENSQKVRFEEFPIHQYLSFKEAHDSAYYSFSLEQERSNCYNWEDKEFLHLDLFLIQQIGEECREVFLKNKDNSFPMGNDLMEELSDKVYLEMVAKSKGHKDPIFGEKPLYWDQPPKPKKYELEDYDQLVDSLSAWREIGFYYMVYCGKTWGKFTDRRTFVNHDLVQARQAAMDFFDDVLQELDPSNAVTLVMGLIDSEMAPLVLRTTDSNLNSKTIKGCNGEKEIFASLGITPFTQEK